MPDRQSKTLPTHIIVVEQAGDWRDDLPEQTVVTARDYLSDPSFMTQKGVKVINLCRSYSYLSTGYYCSLLAEARRHRVLPGVKTLSELTRKALYSLEASDLDESMQKQLGRSSSDTVDVHLYFGHCEDKRFQDIGRQVFDLFPCPLLRIEFKRNGRWSIQRIRSVGLNQLDAEQRAAFGEALTSYTSQRWRSPRARTSYRCDLAVLFNPDDPLPPSDPRALKKLVRVGKTLGVNVEVIGRRDYGRLAEYDALFIRETTRMDHYTYKFARKAESEGMVVIDDPDSILRCTNKVYLAELLRTHKVPRPKTVILQKGQAENAEAEIPYPIVLKIPDGSFSRGVYKARDHKELMEITAKLFKESDLILAQEYVYTAYDWRIGVLDRKPLFTCQYFMSKDHWQIVNHKPGGRISQGGYRTLGVADTPPDVLEAALKAANLIGDGLYGVDVKQNERGCYVIEVNDNPNIEAGVEDAYLKDELYRILLLEFLARLEKKRKA